MLAYETGGGNGARLQSLSGTTGGFDIWNATLIAPTARTTYSAASANVVADDAALLSQAIGSNAAVTTQVAGLSQFGFFATGASFTVDQTLTLSDGLYVQATGPITVANALTLPGTNVLALNTASTLSIDAPVTVTGAGAVNLTENGGGVSFDLGSSGFAGDIQFTGTPHSGQSLTIDGTAYTLLYSMGDVQNINNNLNSNYALAGSLNASGTSGSIPLGTDGAGNRLNNGNGFAGLFEGLGNTISNLTVNIGGNNYAGLFGYASGTIRDIGLIGGSVTGSWYVGGLVGDNNNGTITNAYASGAVSGPGSYVGGLVGANDAGTITNAYATGAVSRAGSYVGGLVGRNHYGTITNAYATGAVSGGSMSAVW